MIQTWCNEMQDKYFGLSIKYKTRFILEHCQDGCLTDVNRVRGQTLVIKIQQLVTS